MTFCVDEMDAWIELAVKVGWEMADAVFDGTSFAVAFGPGFTIEPHHGGFLIKWETGPTETGGFPG